MTSQLLFGEHFEILEHQDSFQRIRVAGDGYEGWISGRQGEAISQNTFEELSQNPPPMLADLVAPATLGEKTLHLARGSHLPEEINGRPVICEGARISSNTFPNAAQIAQIAADYLHSPYHWGGKSPFGIDCSGLTQMVYRLNGVNIPRDSQDQVREGELVPSIGESRPGDLAFFFENTSHVGLVLDGGIIHAAGFVRIDDLDERGIRDRQTGEYSHRLDSIRRYF